MTTTKESTQRKAVHVMLANGFTHQEIARMLRIGKVRVMALAEEGSKNQKEVIAKRPTRSGVRQSCRRCLGCGAAITTDACLGCEIRALTEHVANREPQAKPVNDCYAVLSVG